MSRADPGGAPLAPLLGVQLFQPLGEDLLELVDRSTLEQHVPVRAHVLGLLGLGLAGITAQRRGSAAAAVPGRWDVGVAGQRYAERVPVRAVIDGLPARRQVRVAVGLIARCSEAAAPKDSLTHVASWRKGLPRYEQMLDSRHSRVVRCLHPFGRAGVLVGSLQRERCADNRHYVKSNEIGAP